MSSNSDSSAPDGTRPSARPSAPTSRPSAADAPAAGEHIALGGVPGSSMPPGTDILDADGPAPGPLPHDQHSLETGDFVIAASLGIEDGPSAGGQRSGAEDPASGGRTASSDGLPEEIRGEIPADHRADPADSDCPIYPADQAESVSSIDGDPAEAANAAPSDQADPADPDGSVASVPSDRVDPGKALGELFEGLGVLPIESFPQLDDRALVSAISDTPAHGFLDALRLRRIAELYTRSCMRPLAPHEFVDAENGFTGTGSDAAGKRSPKGQGQKKTIRERGYGIRPLTRRELTAAEVVAALKISPFAADRQVQLAVTLTTRLPHTLDALQHGRLDYKRVELVEKYFTPLLEDHYGQARRAGLSPADAEQVAMATGAALEGFVFPVIWHAHPCTVHEVCAAAVIMVDPQFVERTRKNAVKGRYLAYRKDGDMGEIFTRLGAAEAQGIITVVDTYARIARSQGDERSLEVLRVDAFADLILHGHLPDGTRPAPG